MHDDRLEQLLMEQGAVSSDQLLVARQQSLKMQTPLADVLINSGLIAQRISTLLTWLCKQCRSSFMCLILRLCR